MTIGIEEARRRNHMTQWCSSRGRHEDCNGYYVRAVQPWGRELDFCKCECHSTRWGPIAPVRVAPAILPTNPGVSGEGDSS